MSFLFSSHTFTRHRGCPSGVSPVGQSVPEILDGYVSTIDEPFQVFKCNPPSTCPFEELGIFLAKMVFFFFKVPVGAWFFQIVIEVNLFLFFFANRVDPSGKRNRYGIYMVKIC